MERLTDTLRDVLLDVIHRHRIRRQLTLIAAYTMKERNGLRPVPPDLPANLKGAIRPGEKSA